MLSAWPVGAGAPNFSTRARISSTRQTDTLGDNFVAGGYMPVAIPRYQCLLEIGISAKTTGNLMKPISGNCGCDLMLIPACFVA